MRSESRLSVCVVIGLTLTLAVATAAPVIGAGSKEPGGGKVIKDYDPLVDIELTITINEIRALDYLHTYPGNFWWWVAIGSLDKDGAIIWNTVGSPVYRYYDGYLEAHLYPDWSFTADVEDGSEFCWFEITLFNEIYFGAGYDGSEPCDISPDECDSIEEWEESCRAEFSWSQKYGRVNTGDDAMGDQTGRYHLSGIEDRTFGYEDDDNDCELYYSITWNDYDEDGLTWWEEVNVYGTDPTEPDFDKDLDGDGLPLWYEDLYGLNDQYYNPTGDKDRDGLTNIEEYTFRSFGTAPDYPDILVEVDYVDGYELNDFVQDAVEKYFANYRLPSQDGSPGPFGANIIFDIDDMLTLDEVDPGDNGVTEAEFQSVIYQHFTPGWDGVWRYMLWGNKLIESDSMELTLFEAPREMFYALGTVERLVDDYNDNWLDPDVNLQHVVICQVLHQLGHSLDIIDLEDEDGDGRVAEDHCDDPSCVMHLFDGHDFHDNIDYPYGPLFCSDHWSMLDLSVWETDPISTLPRDADDTDPNV